MKKLILSFGLLASCGQTHVETRIQQVYCVTPAQYKKLVDIEPAKIGSLLTGNAQKDFKLSAGQNVALRSYSDGLLEVLGGCVGNDPIGSALPHRTGL